MSNNVAQQFNTSSFEIKGTQHIPTKPGLRIVKMLIIETGTYDQQWRRPYATDLRGNTLNCINERLRTMDKFSPALVSGIATQFISPTATPEKPIDIANGWNERRFRFAMEIEYTHATGGRIREMVLGYTDYTGISPQSGAIDPSMEFYINSTVQIRTIVERTPFAIANEYTSIIDNSHVLANDNFSSAFAPNNDQRMRPEDVYSAISRSHLTGTEGGLTDTRTLLTGVAIKSRRVNGLASNYMSTVLQGYRSALETEAGQSEQQVLSQAKGFAGESMAARDPLLSALANVRGMPVGKTFRWRDLQTIDPNVDNVTDARYLAPTQRAEVYMAGHATPWGASDRETQVATILSQSVPGIMMDNGLTMLSVMAHNRVINGTPFLHVNGVRSFSNGTDLSPYIRNFELRFQQELLNGISFDGLIDYAIEIYADLNNDTRVTVSLDGGQPQTYVTPSFCDAMLVPVVTGNPHIAQSIASDFDGLVGILNDACHNTNNTGIAFGSL